MNVAGRCRDTAADVPHHEPLFLVFDGSNEPETRGELQAGSKNGL